MLQKGCQIGVASLQLSYPLMASVNSNNDEGDWQKVCSKSNRKRMSKHNRKKSLPNIPIEIIIEILLRLPVKSLLRFRCVSKLWQSSISHPKFTIDYPSHKHRHGKIAVRPGPGLLASEVYSVDSCNAAAYSSSSCVELLINEKNIGWFQLLGSCNGLLLVSHYTNLYLWNPATRQCTKMLSLRCYDYVIKEEISGSSGLCYDSSADDYKAVMVYDGKVSVASFRRRIWATTACCFADGGEKVMNSGPVVNGKLHWVINQTGIAYFDPITDEFVELPAPTQPHSFRERKTVILGLGVLDGCLCMAQGGCESGAEFEPSFIEVFVMREYGLGESWRSIFIMSNVEFSRLYEYGNLVPLCFTNNGEVFIAVNRNKLFVYNPNEMSRREIPIPNDRYELEVTSYTESLASPNAYGHEEDWYEKGEDACELVDWFCWSCCYGWDGHARDLELLNLTYMEAADEEDHNCVWEKFWKKEENQEKFKRRYKARLYFQAAKERKLKRRNRIRTESEITPPRKNKKDRKHGKNLELDDLHKQVLHVVTCFVEVFVMWEYGSGESWRSIFIMSNVELSRPYEYGNLVPLCFTKNGEVFIAVNKNKLFVYNPNEMSRREIPIPNCRYKLHVASYTESLASPNAYGHKEDWIETGEDALELVEYFWFYDSYSWDGHDLDSELLNLTYMEAADEEDDNWVWKEFWEKEENQEKFERRYKARLYFLAAKEKKQKRRNRIRTESKITPPRKNKKDRKHGKNLELDDLHKQVLDFFVK